MKALFFTFTIMCLFVFSSCKKELQYDSNKANSSKTDNVTTSDQSPHQYANSYKNEDGNTETEVNSSGKCNWILVSCGGCTKPKAVCKIMGRKCRCGDGAIMEQSIEDFFPNLSLEEILNLSPEALNSNVELVAYLNSIAIPE